MPELPEVETSRVLVERELGGLTVASVTVRLPKLLRDSPVPTLDPLVGQMILAAKRRAKVLMIDFSDDLTLMVHFKLSGQLAIIRADGNRFVAGHPVPDPAGDYPHKATHVEIAFTDGTTAYFSDIRQFGWFRLMHSDNVDSALAHFKFGPEGTGENAITTGELAESLSRRSIPVKTAILDQSVVAGVGNIYADEALFHARIHPLTPANKLSPNKVKALKESIAWALDMGIQQGGASIVNQKATQYDDFPAVHGREGESCMRCCRPILKMKVGTRGTYYCSNCQRRPRVSRPCPS